MKIRNNNKNKYPYIDTQTMPNTGAGAVNADFTKFHIIWMATVKFIFAKSNNAIY